MAWHDRVQGKCWYVESSLTMDVVPTTMTEFGCVQVQREPRAMVDASKLCWNTVQCIGPNGCAFSIQSCKLRPWSQCDDYWEGRWLEDDARGLILLIRAPLPFCPWAGTERASCLCSRKSASPATESLGALIVTCLASDLQGINVCFSWAAKTTIFC